MAKHLHTAQLRDTGTANVAPLAAVHRAQHRRFFLIIILFSEKVTSPHLQEAFRAPAGI